MSDLPAGWEWATLDEIGNYINGRAFKRSEWSRTGNVPIIRIQNLTGTGREFNFFEGDLEDRHTARSGDLLISWAATLGAYLWNGPDAAVNQHIFKVESYIDVRFHYYLVDHLIESLYLRTQGSGIVHVTRGKFGSIEFMLPPIAEQRRIVAALEDHLSHLDAGRRSLVAARSRLKRLNAASLVSEVDAATAPDGRLADVLDSIEAGRSFGGSGHPAGDEEWGIIKVSAMTWGEFRQSENKAVTDSSRIERRFEIKPGDVLVSRANTIDYVGAAVLVRSTRPKLLLSDKSLRLKPKPGVDTRWLVEILSSPSVRQQIAEKSTGNQESMRNISQAALLSVRIPLHDADQQSRLADVLADRRVALGRLDADLAKTSTAASGLRRSLLAETFAGRLVPQDPNDEPASVLLDRIRADRAALPNPRRTRRTAAS